MVDSVPVPSQRLCDPFSGISHLVGAFLSVAALGVLTAFAAVYGDVTHIVSFSIFGFTMFLMYTSSSLYHLLPLKEKAKRLFRRIDHIMIFLFIAGTYTPVCLVGLSGAWGWSLFGVAWGLALTGIILKAVWLHAPRWLSTAVYVLMGWMATVAIYPMTQTFTVAAMTWLFLGGVAYTLGAVVYALKKPDPWPGTFGFHEIWHLFVMAGSACHFWLILRHILFLG
jgi:hemolysin III